LNQYTPISTALDESESNSQNFIIEELRTYRFRCKKCNKYCSYEIGSNDYPCDHCTGISPGAKQYKLIEMDVWTTPKGKKVENPVRKEGLVRHKEMVRVEF
tara:strand:- start:1801 stop:2103 length:303 start_codon:yes stop_codon:yes gene_type:complete